MYEFNRVNPPKLDENPDIFAIDKSNLSFTVGQTEWVDKWKFRTKLFDEEIQILKEKK